MTEETSSNGTRSRPDTTGPASVTAGDADPRSAVIAGSLTFFDSRTQEKVSLLCRGLTVEKLAAPAPPDIPTARLWIEVPWEYYIDLLEHEHFYLVPQLFIPAQPPPFHLAAVQMSLRLHPALFATLPESVRQPDDDSLDTELPDPQTVWTFLQAHNRAAPRDPLFTLESWMALAAWQPLDPDAPPTAIPAAAPDAETIGFRTLWHEFTPSFSHPDSLMGEETLTAIFSFLAQRGEFQGLGSDNLAAVAERIDALSASLEEFSPTAHEGVPGERPADAETGLIPDTIAALFAAYFDTVAWPYVPAADGNVLQLYAQGENGAWPCFALAREEHAQAIFYSRLPFPAPPARRPALIELITRINYALAEGNFEMDLADGEIRFKTSLSAEGQKLTLGWLHNLVESNLSSMDYYLPALTAVAQEGRTPADALDALEEDRTGDAPPLH